jgi:aryl-alcohol dehydrogenase (NADP+)
MEALNDLVRAGKVRYIGASSMFTYQLAKAQHIAEEHGWTKFVSMQNHYNLIYREEEREMIPYCREEGLAIIPWSPLARGFLSGSRTRNNSGETERSKSDRYATEMYFQEADFQVLDRVIEIAKNKNVKPAQIALAWLLHQDSITAPIIGVTKLDHLNDAIGALNVKLEKEEREYLESVYVPHKVLGHS